MTHIGSSSRIGFLVSLLGSSCFALVVGGCSGTPADGHEQLGSARSAVCTGTPGPLSVVARFDPDADQLPESVTLDRDGTFYMSMANTVTRLTPPGSLEVFADIPIPDGTFVDGVKIGPDGDVYAVTGGFSTSPPAAGIWHIEKNGTVHQVAATDPTGFLDDLVFDDDGSIYATDPFLGIIWKVSPSGTLTQWLTSPLFLGDPAHPAVVVSPFGACGIVFDAKKRNLYLANLDRGSILRVPLGKDREAGVPEVFVQSPLLVGADGFAFDKDGTLWVGAQTQDRLATVAPDGTISVILQGGLLDAPASMVFGTQGNDKDTLYITNFAINRSLGTQPGTPHPALLSLPVGVKGQPLP